MNKPLQYILNISALKTRLYPRVFCDHTMQKLLDYHCIKLHAFVWFPGPPFVSAHPFSFNHVSTQIDCDHLFAWFPALKTPSPPLSHKSACYLFTEAADRVHLHWSPSSVNTFTDHPLWHLHGIYAMTRWWISTSLRSKWIQEVRTNSYLFVFLRAWMHLVFKQAELKSKLA